MRQLCADYEDLSRKLGRRLLALAPRIYGCGSARAHYSLLQLVYCLSIDRDFVKMRSLIIAVAVFAVAQSKPVLIYTQPLHPVGIEYAPTAVPQVQPHPAVELNAASEALLPRELLKSPNFYDNPAIAEGLAKESWFTNKEMQVVEREAEKIPREKIYNIVKSAGFLDQH